MINIINIKNYKTLGTGQHGIALLNMDNNKVYKYTTSSNEMMIAKKQYEFKSSVIAKIYEINDSYYVRDMFLPISEDFAEQIAEEIEDIEEFFYSKYIDVRKSQTNLDFYFEDKFLNFLNDLKRDLKKMEIKDFDVEGMCSNVYTDKNGNYILADF
jgi:hypothetical protein